MTVPVTEYRITWMREAVVFLMLPAVLCQRNLAHIFAASPPTDGLNTAIGWKFYRRVE